MSVKVVSLKCVALELSVNSGYVNVCLMHQGSKFMYLHRAVYVSSSCRLCIFIVPFLYLHRASWHSSATLIEVYPCFFLSCKANASVKPAKTGPGPHSSKTFVLFYVLFVLCRSVYCACV